MSTRQADKAEKERVALLQGTLDLLILRTLVFGPQHGQGIARAIMQQAEDTLLVDHGSLYPALQRLETKGWIAAYWDVTENSRRAKYYKLTATGRRAFEQEQANWRQYASMVEAILGTR